MNGIQAGSAAAAAAKPVYNRLTINLAPSVRGPIIEALNTFANNLENNTTYRRRAFVVLQDIAKVSDANEIAHNLEAAGLGTLSVSRIRRFISIFSQRVSTPEDLNAFLLGSLKGIEKTPKEAPTGEVVSMEDDTPPSSRTSPFSAGASEHSSSTTPTVLLSENQLIPTSDQMVDDELISIPEQQVYTPFATHPNPCYAFPSSNGNNDWKQFLSKEWQ